ncbi:ANTAR domain-containing protein [Nocardioides KLBMP 9356]|uniref:ANTAR domain-containing protein n=1 Tax=Nocardioides potassii TaxID=2911371 RepID=A0ABS9HCA6_9ACTN|nr:ANTAR domain-containing protein [Nocardioides potassii]MCF6377870.1 ANTAR domain-containing protein [Nocardioides potassii]
MSGTPPSLGEPAFGPEPDADGLREEIAQLQQAVQAQRAIGMAVGLVSARYGCSTEQAWRTILRVSQHSNTKVRTVARTLVAVHDATATAEDLEVLRTFEAQLPASGWSAGPSA